MDLMAVRDKAANAFTEARKRLDEAVELPADDARRAELEGQHDKLMEEYDSHMATAKRIERSIRVEAAQTARDEQRVSPERAVSGEEEDPDGGKIMARRRAFLKRRKGKRLSDAETALAATWFPAERVFERLLRVGPTGLADGERRRLDEWAKTRAVAGQNVGTEADGGYAVPEVWMDGFISELGEMSPMFDPMYSNRIVTSGGGDYRITVETSSKNRKSVQIAEATDTVPTKFVFRQVAMKAWKHKNATAFSAEVREDVNFDIMADLTRLLTPGFALGYGEDFTVGTATGATKPQGVTRVSAGRQVDVVTAETDGIPAAASGKGFIAPDLFELEQKVRPMYRRLGSMWQFATAAVPVLRRLRDAEGKYILQPDFRMGQPGTVLGYPWVENPDLPDLTASNLPVMFGAFTRGYATRIVGSMRVRLDPLPESDQDAVYAYMRADGRLIDENALAALKVR